MRNTAQNNQWDIHRFILPLCILMLTLVWFFRASLVDFSVLCRSQALIFYDKSKHYFYRLDTLVHENSHLQMLINEQQIELTRLSHIALRNDQLADEIKDLKKILRVKDKSHEPVVVSVQHAWDQFTHRALRVGFDGNVVHKGMLALDVDGHVIGRVSEVSRHSAVVRLLHDKMSALPVVVGARKVQAVAMGNGTDIDLLHLPIDSGITAGDMVYASSHAGHVARVYQIGEVHSVQDSPDQSFLIARVRPRASLRMNAWLVLT